MPQPRVSEINALGHLAFDRDRAPEVFGFRSGWGPLVIFPDTNILIELYSSTERIEELAAGVGSLGGPYVGDSWPTVADALRDLVAVWFYRDVRFWTGHVHATDGKKPRTPERERALCSAIRTLQDDAWARGGVKEPSYDHVGRRLDWPPSPLDRRLLETAFRARCDVFLTEDRRVLKCDGTFRDLGLRVLRPADLLELLDAAHELEPTSSSLEPLPDLRALSTWYALRTP